MAPEQSEPCILNVATTLSLVICTYRRPQPIRRVLEAITRQTRVPNEIVIVDGSPGEETEKVVKMLQCREILPSLRYFRVPPEHRGLTRQRNYGIARANGEIIAFLDDDTVPEPDYFEELLTCFVRHPDALGIGGFIVSDELQWKQVDGKRPPSLSVLRWGDWERREDFRWRARKILGLDSPLPPGWMPPSSHGRSTSSYPPNGDDHHVEFIMGGASAWRHEVFENHTFSTYFDGYGLYEDLDFCVRVSRDGPLYLCTRARLAHYHAPSARPNQFRYGIMVVRNGWFVWRRRWPNPPWSARIRWWSITILMILCRLGDALRGPRRRQAVSEAAGRFWGIVQVLVRSPARDLHIA